MYGTHSTRTHKVSGVRVKDTEMTQKKEQGEGRNENAYIDRRSEYTHLSYATGYSQVHPRLDRQPRPAPSPPHPVPNPIRSPSSAPS